MDNKNTNFNKYKLNSMQKKLVEDNHNLIYWYIWNHHFPEDDPETMECWYFVLAEALCKAAATFKPESGNKFSTYAVFVMQNEVRRVWRKNSQASHIPVGMISSADEAAYVNDKDGSDVRLIDMLEAVNDTENEAIANTTLAKVLRMAPDNHKIIIALTADGFKQKEIANVVGMSQTNVSRILKKYARYFSA